MEQPTAEETLDKFLEGFDWPHWSKDNAIMAMEEYASAAVSKVQVQEKPIGYIIMRNFTVKIGEPNDEFEVHPVYMPLSNPSTTKP